MKKICLLLLSFFCLNALPAQHSNGFNGRNMSMSTLPKLSDAKSRSISPENFTGEKGKGGMADPATRKGKRNVANAANEARDLGKGWKVNPFIIIGAGETFTMAEIAGPGGKPAVNSPPSPD